MIAPGLIVAAPNSGSGKTLVTLGIVAALRAGGAAVAVAKAGPDYIDTGFLAAAAGRPCVNLDPWAMRQATLSRLVRDAVSDAVSDADILIIEGVMGLFDGGAGGAGSTADLAVTLGLPVVLVVDASQRAQSVGALVRGFATHRADLALAGVILNRVAGDAHEMLIREGFAGLDIPILGTVGRSPDLTLASRHLGLIQAVERRGLDITIGKAADLVSAGVDLKGVTALARPPALTVPAAAPPPLGQRVAVAFDPAFGFAYHHLLQGWRDSGAEVLTFSPLADEAPDVAADVVFLPGGYPELHAGRLAANQTFLDGMRTAAARECLIHGECGGYMVLGEKLVDGDGNAHAMAGLLQLETSFAAPRLTLGYRAAKILKPWGFCPGAASLRGHEFHYAQVLREVGEPLFECRTAGGELVGNAGLRQANVSGSFFHLIEIEE